jgi:hypothetical protein
LEKKINLFVLSGIKKRFHHLTGRSLDNIPVRSAGREMHRLQILTSKNLLNEVIRNVQKTELRTSLTVSA